MEETVTIKQLSGLIEEALNLNLDGVLFDINSNIKDFNTKVADFIRENDCTKSQGVMTIVTSDIAPIVGIGQSTVTAMLRILANQENQEQLTKIISETVNTLSGKQFVIGNNIIMVNFSYPQVGTSGIKLLGETLAIETVCYFTIIEKGITFSDSGFKVDDVLLPITGFSFGIDKDVDNNNFVNSTISYNNFKSQGITLSVQTPFTKNPTILKLFSENFMAREANLQARHKVSYFDNAGNSVVIFMGVKSMMMSGEPLKCNGLQIDFVELK